MLKDTDGVKASIIGHVFVLAVLCIFLFEYITDGCFEVRGWRYCGAEALTLIIISNILVFISLFFKLKNNKPPRAKVKD